MDGGKTSAKRKFVKAYAIVCAQETAKKLAKRQAKGKSRSVLARIVMHRKHR